MKELTMEATIENITRVTEFVDGELDTVECPVKVRRMIDIAIDELCSNVARYAYAPETGMVTVRLELKKDPQAVVLTFVDSGIPYNPLIQEDPNTTLPLKERRIGGLGIYMVKRSMDDMHYEYLNGENIVTITKQF